MYLRVGGCYLLLLLLLVRTISQSINPCVCVPVSVCLCVCVSVCVSAPVLCLLSSLSLLFFLLSSLLSLLFSSSPFFLSSSAFQPSHQHTISLSFILCRYQLHSFSWSPCCSFILCLLLLSLNLPTYLPLILVRCLSLWRNQTPAWPSHHAPSYRNENQKKPLVFRDR